MTDPTCLICSMEDAPAAARVFRTEQWAAEVAPGYEVPGWFFLRARRHAEKVTGLDDSELATYGPQARDLVAAIEAATGAPAVYLLSFGENYIHFHALVAARTEDIPPESRGGALLGLLTSHRDPEAAYALAARVREAHLAAHGPVAEAAVT